MLSLESRETRPFYVASRTRLVRCERSRYSLLLDIHYPDVATVVSEQENDLIACDNGRRGADHRWHDHFGQDEHVDQLRADGSVDGVEGASRHPVSNINRWRRRQVVQQSSVSRPERVTRVSIDKYPPPFVCCVRVVEPRHEHRGRSARTRGIEGQPPC